MTACRSLESIEGRPYAEPDFQRTVYRAFVEVEMLSLIIFVVVLGLLYWASTLLPLLEPFPLVVKVLFVILLVIVLLNFAGVNLGGLSLPKLQ